jgi:MFS family permease
MTPAIALLRAEPRARLFFAALAQSSLGTGAAYVALLVIAYERFHSPWAISLVLLADFMPVMLLGPVFGAAADRWSRRWCAVAADVVRAAAFVGLALASSFEATVAFAVLAGTGTALFKPAVLAGLPSLVQRERTAAATSLYGAVTDVGYTAGPALAAALLVVTSPEDLMLVNGVTFAISAAVLSRLPFGSINSDTTPQEGPSSLFRDTREGIRATAGMPAIRVVIGASAGAMFFAGVFNVVELPFALSELGATDAGFAVLVAVFGFGFIFGSLQGSRGGKPATLKRRYLQGLGMMGAGGLIAGISPTFAPALAGFAFAGFGNGLFLVHERLLFQTEVSQRLQGRVFGVSEALISWGFAVAFVSGGAMAELAGTRAIVVFTGVGGLALASGAVVALRGHWRPIEAGVPAYPRPIGPLAERAGALRNTHAGQNRPDLVGGASFWLTLLDDLGDSGRDVRVELSTGIRN